MKLEVGMYVRLNCNYELGIGKTIEEIDEDNFIKTKFKDNFECSLPTYMITKASHNIIDLIEVGDYVNGCYVSNKRASVNEHLGGHPKGIGIIKCNTYFNQGNYDDCKFEWIEEKDIKSIVTKEQFESIKYSLEG